MRHPITAVHQIEITSRCNLRCRYCPSPHLPRAKEDMTEETWRKALGWAAHYANRGTAFELNLAGIGESTIHPHFADWVLWARETLGPRVELTMATNGLVFAAPGGEEMAAKIAPAKPHIWVSLHRPEKGGPAIEVLKRHGMLWGVSTDPATASIDWAGQLAWPVSARKGPCPWVRGGWVFVMSDGRVSACCLDADGSGVLGTVDDDLTRLSTRPYKLCVNCHLDVGVPLGGPVCDKCYGYHLPDVKECPAAREAA